MSLLRSTPALALLALFGASCGVALETSESGASSSEQSTETSPDNSGGTTQAQGGEQEQTRAPDQTVAGASITEASATLSDTAPELSEATVAARDGYVGVWTLDAEASIERARNDAAEHPMGEMMVTMAEMMFGSVNITLSLDVDGSSEMSMQGELMGQPMDEAQSGSWRRSEDGIVLVGSGDDPNNGTAQLTDVGLVIQMEAQEGEPGPSPALVMRLQS